jgi:hypothetical protein
MEDLYKTVSAIVIGALSFFLKKTISKVDEMEKQMNQNTTAIAVAAREKELQKEYFDKMTLNLQKHIDDKINGLEKLMINNAKK